MRTLSAYDLVQVWEWGQHKHPVDCALGLLTLAQPELNSKQVARLSVGQRNTRLLWLREQTLGPTLNGYAECPHCREKLEFSIETPTLHLPEPQEMEFDMTVQEYKLHCHLPNSHDLAALIGYRDVAVARKLLIERCIVQASYQDQPVEKGALPESLIPELAHEVIIRDPQAEMRFELECPACGQQWSALFDIFSFFWIELEDRVKRLLYDVHLLAQAYGWSEHEILSMSTSRRQLYLDWIGNQS